MGVMIKNIIMIEPIAWMKKYFIALSVDWGVV